MFFLTGHSYVLDLLFRLILCCVAVVLLCTSLLPDGVRTQSQQEVAVIPSHHVNVTGCKLKQRVNRLGQYIKFNITKSSHSNIAIDDIFDINIILLLQTENIAKLASWSSSSKLSSPCQHFQNKSTKMP